MQAAAEEGALDDGSAVGDGEAAEEDALELMEPGAASAQLQERFCGPGGDIPGPDWFARPRRLSPTIGPPPADVDPVALAGPSRATTGLDDPWFFTPEEFDAYSARWARIHAGLEKALGGATKNSVPLSCALCFEEPRSVRADVAPIAPSGEQSAPVAPATAAPVSTKRPSLFNHARKQDGGVKEEPSGSASAAVHAAPPAAATEPPAVVAATAAAAPARPPAVAVLSPARAPARAQSLHPPAPPSPGGQPPRAQSQPQPHPSATAAPGPAGLQKAPSAGAAPGQAQAQAQAKAAPPPARYSSLSVAEHSEYMSLLRRAAADEPARAAAAAAAAQGLPAPGPTLSPAEEGRLRELRARVDAEAAEFHRWCHARAVADPRPYAFLHSSILQQLQAVLELKRARMRAFGHRFVRVADWRLDLAGIEPAPGDPRLKHSATLLRLGRVLEYAPPQPNARLEPSTLAFDLGPAAPSLPLLRRRPGHWLKKSMPPVSEDERAAALAAERGAHVVTSSGALAALVDNFGPSFASEWTLPVVVTGEYGSAPPLLPPFTQAVAFFSRARRSHVAALPPARPSPWVLRPARTLEERRVFVDKPLLRSRLTFREKNATIYKALLQSEGLKTEGQSSLPFSAAPAPAPAPAPAASFSSPFGVETGEAEATATAASAASAAGSLADDNLTYTLWSFGPDLSLLVRCRWHAILPEPGSQPGYRCVGVVPKLEYRPEEGWEQVTASETARWWVRTYLRPDAHLIVGRVALPESRIARLEKLTTADILYPGCPFRPERHLKVALEVFRRLRLLPAGRYLLSHRRGDPEVGLFRCADGEASSVPPALGSGSNPAGAVPGPGPEAVDLHELSITAGATDTEAVAYVPLIWSGPPDRAPFTFPPSPEELRPPPAPPEATGSGARGGGAKRGAKRARGPGAPRGGRGGAPGLAAARRGPREARPRGGGDARARRAARPGPGPRAGRRPGRGRGWAPEDGEGGYAYEPPDERDVAEAALAAAEAPEAAPQRVKKRSYGAAPGASRSRAYGARPAWDLDGSGAAGGDDFLSELAALRKRSAELAARDAAEEAEGEQRSAPPPGTGAGGREQPGGGGEPSHGHGHGHGYGYGEEEEEDEDEGPEELAIAEDDR
eukprot:tig00020592_g11688.t1